jgi:glyoxylase I family protein
MQITHYLHTALRVSNLEQAEYFYGTVLRLPKVDRQLRFPGAWYQLGDVQVHLILDINLEQQAPSSEQWGRDRHLAFAVADLPAAKAHLLQQGCKIQVSASGRAALFTQDPDGNIIELSQT